jgi:hypothetical protein
LGDERAGLNNNHSNNKPNDLRRLITADPRTGRERKRKKATKSLSQHRKREFEEFSGRKI